MNQSTHFHSTSQPLLKQPFRPHYHNIDFSPYNLTWANSVLKEHFHVHMKKIDSVGGRKKWIIRKVKLKNKDENKKPHEKDAEEEQMKMMASAPALSYPLRQQNIQMINLRELIMPFNNEGTISVYENKHASAGEPSSNNGQYNPPKTAPYAYNLARQRLARNNSLKTLKEESISDQNSSHPHMNEEHEVKSKPLEFSNFRINEEALKPLPIFHTRFADNIEKVSFLNKLNLI